MKDLVGQGKPLYSSLDKAAGLLKRKVGTGSEFLKELMAIPGVKQTEVAERGLGELLNAPKMTHEQFLRALGEKPAPAVKEKINSVVNTDDPSWLTREERDNPPEGLTHHEQWTIPGGENYREMLIKAPKSADQFPGNPHHFGGEPGILASMRLKDRTGPNGEKLLHLEELQSDWHQQGREHGYRVPGFAQQKEDFLSKVFEASKKHSELQDQFNKSAEWSKELDKRLNSNHPDFQPGGYRRKEVEEQKAFHDKNVVDLLPQVMRAEDEHRNLEQEFNKKYSRASKAVPDAPFKKNWEEMALKRLVHHAAEKGYHGIVVTPGDEQADRYDLSKHADKISYFPDTKTVVAYKDNKSVVEKRIDEPSELESVIGKEAANKLLERPTEKIVNARGDQVQSLSGLDLKVGGEGMKGFYDKKVPNILNSIGKKYGVKTQLHGVSTANPKTGQSITDMLRAEGLSENDWQDLTVDQRMAMIDRHDQRAKQNTAQLHYFPITDQMRQDVLKNGLPLYKQGGDVHASLDKMKYELSNRKG